MKIVWRFEKSTLFIYITQTIKDKKLWKTQQHYKEKI